MIFNKSNAGADEVKKYATWTSANRQYEHIVQALELTKRKVLKLIGKPIYDVALTHYLSAAYETTTTPEIIKLNKLVHLLQNIFVNFAYAKNIDKDTFVWDGSGVNVTWSENFRPAQEQTLEKLEDSLNDDAYEMLDMLIEYLNEDATLFAAYKSSVQALKLKELFVSNAEEFNYYFNIRNSVCFFYQVIDFVRRVQNNQIKNALTLEYYNELYAYNLDNAFALTKLTVLQCTDLLAIIKPCIVDYTMYNKFLADKNNLKPTSKQVDVMYENAKFHLDNAETELSQIAKYIEKIKIALAAAEVPPVIKVPVEKHFYTNNSFSI